MAFTPKTGEEMRGFVRDFLNDEVDKWREAYKGAVSACECEKK